MNPSFQLLLVLVTFSGTFGKHVFVDGDMTWGQAQAYCREHYVDLAPINNEYDNSRLEWLEEVKKEIWIGLEKPIGTKTWKWSGGVEAENFFWAKRRPEAVNGSVAASYLHGFWFVLPQESQRPFLCYDVFLVQEEKTWEEALEYCREQHWDLASVASQTEMMLIQSLLKKSVPSRMVWIGLRSFYKHWLWVDGQPVTYTAWSSQESQTCPPRGMRCAALKVDPMGLKQPGVGSLWEAHDCDHQLPFICY